MGGVGKSMECVDSALMLIASGRFSFDRKERAFAKKPRFLGEVPGEEPGGDGFRSRLVEVRGRWACEAEIPLSWLGSGADVLASL